MKDMDMENNLGCLKIIRIHDHLLQKQILTRKKLNIRLTLLTLASKCDFLKLEKKISTVYFIIFRLKRNLY